MQKTFTFAALALAAATAAPGGELIKAQDATLVVPDSYIVTLHDDLTVRSGSPAGATVADIAADMAHGPGASVTHVYEAVFPGFAVDNLTQEEAAALAADPRVKRVEPNQVVRALATQSPATWGLDRIDQRHLPLNNSYTYNFTGLGVRVYILDTGIRATHQEFGGRVGAGFTSVLDGNGTNDCNGHGTHVAGTVGGATWGVAKQVTLYPVRVLNCAGSGTTAGVVAGVDWVTQNHVKPAVANMSLGGGVQPALDDAVARSIAAGVIYTIAAGNSNADACSFSPARVPTALTVGSSTSADTRSGTSNKGACLDLFAPGNGITSAWHTSDVASMTIGGTSMAAPHVAGVAALYLQQFGVRPPAVVNQAIVDNATVGVLTDPGPGSPNRLLYSLFGPPPAVNGARFVAQSVPTSMVPGGRYAVTVTMQNSGTTSWTPAGLYRLGSQAPQDNLTWGIGRVAVTTPVSPGQSHTFAFTVTAPAAPGVYPFQWRMVQEGVMWFGDFTPLVPISVGTVPGVDAARFVSQSVPTLMQPGEVYSVAVTMQNVGTTTWTAGQNYRLGSQAPPDNVTWGLARVALPHPVAPNQTVTFRFDVVAPWAPGIYNFQWRMVRENVAWFGDASPLTRVRVRLFPQPTRPPIEP